MTSGTATATTDLTARAKAIAPIVAEEADAAERDRRLTDRTVEAMKAQGLIGIWAPESLGGLEVSPGEGFRLFEEVAKTHASAAWNLWIWSTLGQFTATLSEEGVAELFADGPAEAIGAGGLFPLAPAAPVEGGYRVSGRWPYCSGSGHARWLGGGCTVLGEDGQPRMIMPGVPEIRFVTFRREEVEIIDTWHVVGLRATGSNDVAVENGFAPEHLTSGFGPLSPKGRHYQGPLYRFPILGALAAPIGAIALGTARHALDEFVKLAKSKTPNTSQTKLTELGAVQHEVAEAHAAIESARVWLYETVEDAWQTTLAGQPVSMEQRRDLTLAAAHATRSASHAVGIAHVNAGGTAVYETSPIERCFRDVHAATQHAGTAPRAFAGAGRLLLGLTPDNPLILA